MKQALRVACLFAALSTAFGQTTTTHCTQTNSNTDCTTTDDTAQQKADQETADAIVGKPIMTLRVKHGIKKYCKQHPGEPYHWTMPDGTIVRRGTCPKG